MPGQPPPAYVDAYWEDVADELAKTHHAPAAEIPAAVAEFRQHMAPAGQTIYNDAPAEVAETIVAHGLLPSVPPVGICLQLTFKWTDPDKVLDDPMLVARKVAGLIDALSDYERQLGGAGFMTDGAESAPGRVWLYLKPAEASGAMDRLKGVADAVNDPSPVAWQVKQQRDKPMPDLRFPTAAVAVKLAA
jgi:hypothetical protein